MTDSAAHRDSTWYPRDFEAQMLVELLRLSRVTVLYGAQGAGKTMLLKTGVLPLLRRRADDRNFAQDQKPRVVVPFPSRRAGDGTIKRGAEIAIVFDRWSNAPLTALREQILDTLPFGSTRMATALPSLADSLATWNEELGVRFFIILDCFEQYLHAPFDREGIAEFDAEFVRMVNEPRLATSFLLSVRADSEALLNRYRDRISGFGDAFLRLPSLHPVTAPSLAPGAQTPGAKMLRSAAAATPPIAASETLTTRPSEPPTPFVLPAALTAGPLPAGAALLAGSGEPVRSSTVNEGALGNVQPPEVTAGPNAELDAKPGIELSVCELAQPYSGDKRAQFTPVPGAREPAPGEAAPTLPPRPELRRPVRSPARISLAAIVAGFAVGAGAGYFAVYGYQGITTWQTASSPKGAVPATMHTVGLTTVQVPPASRADHLVPPPSSEEPPAVDSSAPPPGSPARIKRAKAASPTPKVASRIAPSPTPEVTSRIAPSQAVPIAAAAAAEAIGWQTAMHRELEICRQGNIFERVVCTEKARWKHCAPDRWNTIPECAAGNTQVTRSD